MQLINFDIIKHPLNWIIVMLMVFIAAMAINAIVKWETPSAT